jgi:hypothetical protein
MFAVGGRCGKNHGRALSGALSKSEKQRPKPAERGGVGFERSDAACHLEMRIAQIAGIVAAP